MAMHKAPISIATVFGTRPEAIKLLPLIRCLARDDRFRLRVAATGQHREMLREIWEPFGIRSDVDLGIMVPGQTLNDIVCRAMPRLDELYLREKPDFVLVQGDTTSAFCAALAAFHRRIPVGHVEAGLRSFDPLHPYPEESNRRMLTSVAHLHFAPTLGASRNLRSEGVPRKRITVTGNTVVDALLLALDEDVAASLGGATDGKNGEECGVSRAARFPWGQRRAVLVTLHRREAWESKTEKGEGSVLDGILLGIRRAAERHRDVDFIYPVHLNPKVQQAAHRALGDTANVKLLEPLPYLRFVRVMAQSSAIVSDSGGVQEEAPSLGIPVLVVRKTTERPEGVSCGANQLVGTDPDRIENALSDVLDRYPVHPAAPIPRPNPFGDGRASLRIVQALLHLFGRADAPDEFSGLRRNPPLLLENASP